MARKRTLILSLAALLLLAATGAGGYLGYRAVREHRFLTVPPETPGRDRTFRVEPGQIFSTIARNLHAAGLITDARRFVRLAVIQGKAASVRAGEFRLNTGWTPDQVLRELTTSMGILQKVSIREGLTWWQTADRVAEAGLGTRQTFAAAVADPALLARFGIAARDAEGYLFPETYLRTPPHDDQSRDMAETMLREFFKHAEKVWPGGLPPFPEMQRVVILASLVEKETGDPSERRRIAGVFVNRLKRGMRLQADPTIIYGLGPDFDGNITKDDLRDAKNPYNTYVHPGLPPGPICSPGLDSLLAAAHPEQNDYLYFVARGDGTHQFSATLREHNNAVIRYQLRRDRRTYRSTPEP